MKIKHERRLPAGVRNEEFNKSRPIEGEWAKTRPQRIKEWTEGGGGVAGRWVVILQRKWAVRRNEGTGKCRFHKGFLENRSNRKVEKTKSHQEKAKKRGENDTNLQLDWSFK